MDISIERASLLEEFMAFGSGGVSARRPVEESK